MCNMNIYIWSGGKWFPFFSLGTVWLTLPTFYSPVALSMCRSSRGNVLVCSPGPSLPGLASGCSHYPLASPPLHIHLPPAPPIPWQLAWLLLTAHPTSHALYPHTLAFITLIPHSHVVEERCLYDTNLYLNECVFGFQVHVRSLCV